MEPRFVAFFTPGSSGNGMLVPRYLGPRDEVWIRDVLSELRGLRAAGLRRVVVCVDESLACTDEEVHADAVLRYRKFVDPVALVAAAERIVGGLLERATGNFRAEPPVWKRSPWEATTVPRGPILLGVLYRAMTPASDGLPLVARSARALGVRVPQDVSPDAHGEIASSSGGMSAAPCSVLKVPNHRRPLGMGHGATGPRQDRVYAVAFENVRAVGLAIRPDPAAPLLHAFVEPPEAQTLGAYETALGDTRPSWRQVWP